MPFGADDPLAIFAPPALLLCLLLTLLLDLLFAPRLLCLILGLLLHLPSVHYLACSLLFATRLLLTLLLGLLQPPLIVSLLLFYDFTTIDSLLISPQDHYHCCSFIRLHPTGGLALPPLVQRNDLPVRVESSQQDLRELLTDVFLLTIGDWSPSVPDFP